MAGENENVVKQLLAEKDSKIETLTRQNEQLAKDLKASNDLLAAAKKEAEDAKTALSKDRDERAKAEKEQAGKDAQEAITLALTKGVLKKAEVEGYEKDGAAALTALEKLGQTPKGLRLFCGRLKDGDGQGRAIQMGRTAPAGAPETGGDGDDTDPTQSIHEEATQLAAKEKISYSEALDRIRAKDPKRFEAARAQFATTES